MFENNVKIECEAMQIITTELYGAHLTYFFQIFYCLKMFSSRWAFQSVLKLVVLRDKLFFDFDEILVVYAKTPVNLEHKTHSSRAQENKKNSVNSVIY